MRERTRMHAKNQREEERVKCLRARATVSGTGTAVAGGGGYSIACFVCCVAVVTPTHIAHPFPPPALFPPCTGSPRYFAYVDIDPRQRWCMSPCARLGSVLALVSPAPERFGPVTWSSPSSSDPAPRDRAKRPGLCPTMIQP